MRSVSALAQAVAKQQERLRASRDAGANSLRAAATQAVTNVRERLTDIEGGAAKTLAEYDMRRERLAKYAHAFRERNIAATENTIVTQCAEIADAYADARRPLHDLQTRGDRATLGGVASAIARLVTAVEAVRISAREGKLRCEEDNDDNGENEVALNGLLTSLENRTVDAVIKARAAFVNILDNEFRTFGWPMQIPVPEEDSELIATVNLFVGQLDALQDAAEKSEFISPRTQWQRTLSDSWAIACILRAPLARFKYHFLESFRADLVDNSGGANGTETQAKSDSDPQQTTSRFDRPEWAADFAVKRIQEATPFLREIAMKGPLSAELKFMKGFCRVFADKIAYDCELAMRSSKNDSDADALIKHAAETAHQFDVQLRSSALEGQKLQNGITNNGPFPSALSLLSANNVFFTAWACSELRLAETQVGKRLDKILAGEDSTTESQESTVPNGASKDLTPELDIEAECAEILQMVGEAGNGCRQLNTPALVQDFLRLTELPLLQNLRARLRQPLDDCNWAPSTEKEVFICSRAAWCAQLFEELLEDRIFEPFYAKIEEQGFPLYADDIDRLKSFTERACLGVADSVAENFEEAVKESYQHQVRFGELSSQDAAVVLAHDLSEPLCKPMTQLAESLRALVRGAANRKVASRMWRAVASRLDVFFFENVVMQAFAGGLRENVTAASPNNAFLKPRTAAKMARQVAFDAGALVSVFDTVSSAPRNFLPKCAEAAPLIRVAAARVMRPNIAPKQGQEEAIKAVLAIAGDAGETEEDNARAALKEVFEVTAIEPREVLELFAIAGLRKAIPLS